MTLRTDPVVNRLVVALAVPVFRDLVERCGVAERPDHAPAIDHAFQNPFVDAAALCGDLGALGEEPQPVRLMTADVFETYLTSGPGADRLADFAADQGRVDRLVLAYAQFACWYWEILPLGPEPFLPQSLDRPALELLAETGYAELQGDLAAWSNRFGRLVTLEQPGAHGWPPEIVPGLSGS